MIRREHFGAALTSLAGTALLAGLLLHLNARQHRPSETLTALAAELKVEPARKKPPRERRVREEHARPRSAQHASAPRPNLAADISGLGGGIPVFQAADVSALSDSMLGHKRLTDQWVMTEEAVDALPDCGENPMPRPPPRAAQKGVSGSVEVRMLIDATGSVQKTKIIKSDPPGFFDEAVLESLGAWHCRPATYQGQPVKLWITLPIRFAVG